MAFHALEISFPLEYQAPYWKYKPSNLLAHFTGHEGPGSLFSFLKDKGWVTSLNSGPQNLARGFAMFKITIYMTEDGFSKSLYLVYYHDLIHCQNIIRIFLIYHFSIFRCFAHRELRLFISEKWHHFHPSDFDSLRSADRTTMRRGLQSICHGLFHGNSYSLVLKLFLNGTGARERALPRLNFQNILMHFAWINAESS